MYEAVNGETVNKEVNKTELLGTSQRGRDCILKWEWQKRREQEGYGATEVNNSDCFKNTVIKNAKYSLEAKQVKESVL